MKDELDKSEDILIEYNSVIESSIKETVLYVKKSYEPLILDQKLLNINTIGTISSFIGKELAKFLPEERDEIEAYIKEQINEGFTSVNSLGYDLIRMKPMG